MGDKASFDRLCSSCPAIPIPCRCTTNGITKRRFHEWGSLQQQRFFPGVFSVLSTTNQISKLLYHSVMEWSVAVQVVGDLRVPVAPFLCLVQKTCLIAGGANEPVLEAAAQWEDQWRWGMADSCSANVSTITSFWESPFTACSCSVEMKKESVSL